MKNQQRKSAVTAGLSLIIMGIAAIFSYGYVYSSLVVSGDVDTTTRQLFSSPLLFHAGVLGWVVIILCDLVVARALYRYFQHISPKISLITALIRIFYTGVLGVAVFNLILVSDLLHADLVALTGQIMDYLGCFAFTWSAGLIVFGIHLLGLGYLSLQSAEVPRLLGILLYIAGAAYFIVHTGKLFPAYEGLITKAETFLSIPMAVGELAFAFWLIISGGKGSKQTRL